VNTEASSNTDLTLASNSTAPMFLYKKQGIKVTVPPKPPKTDAAGKEKEKETSSLAAHASWHLRQEHFPSLDGNGAAYTTTEGTTGRQSAASRTYLQGAALEKHFEEHFPQRFVIITGPPRLRAIKYKEAPTSRQTTLFAFSKKREAAAAAASATSQQQPGATTRSIKPAWSSQTMALAAREFEVPEGSRFIFLWPDLFDRDILSCLSSFRRPYSANGAKHVGVLTPCPGCNSNMHLHPASNWNCQKGSVRRILDTKGPLFFVSPGYTCTNPQCQNRKSSKNFSPLTPEVWKKYPEELRERYSEYVYTAVADGAGGELLVTEEFCLSILDDSIVFDAKERGYEEEFHRSKCRAVRDYKAFVQAETRYNENNKHNPVPVQAREDFASMWPLFGEKRYDDDFQYPKANKIRKVFEAAFKLVEKFLLQDLFSRTPGTLISWDATFKFLMRTMDDEESDEENNALHVIWGKYGHILSFAFAGSEQDQVFRRLQYFIRERCRRIGGDVEVNKVQYAYSDTCCGGLKDPNLHWFLKIWPGAISWPKKDLFHGFKTMTAFTAGVTHDLNAIYAADLSRRCLLFDDVGKTAAAHRYILKKNANLTVELAREQVMKEKGYKKTIKNCVPCGRILAAEIRDAFVNIQRLDEQRAVQAQAANKGYKKYVKKAIPDVRIGTAKAVENAIFHAERGFWSDPLPMDEMNVSIDPDDPESEQLRIRSTSGGESCNNAIGTLVDSVGRMGPILAYMKLMIQVHRWNLAKDRRLAKVLGIQQPRSMEWYLHQALKDYVASYMVMSYPGDLLISDDFDIEQGWEPIGHYYGRYERWRTIDDKIAASARMATIKSAAVTTTKNATAMMKTTATNAPTVAATAMTTTNAPDVAARPARTTTTSAPSTPAASDTATTTKMCALAVAATAMTTTLMATTAATATTATAVTVTTPVSTTCYCHDGHDGSSSPPIGSFS
jgi:hypothetical protein